MARLKLILGINFFWLALSALTEGLTTLALPVRLLGRVPDGQHATALGLMTAAGLLAGLLMRAWAGVTGSAERHKLWAGSVLVIVGALCAFGLSNGLASLAVTFILVQAAIGLAQAVQPAATPEVMPQSQRGPAFGVQGLMTLSGALLAFVSLGWFLGQGEWTAALLALGGLVLLSFALAARLAPRAAAVEQSASGKPPLREWWRDRTLLGWLTSQFFFIVGAYAVSRFFFFFIAERLRLNAAEAADQSGGLLAVLVLLLMSGAPAGGWIADRAGRAAPMIFGALLSAGSVLGLAAAHSIITILLYAGLLAFGLAIFGGSALALTRDLADRESMSRLAVLGQFGAAGAAATAGLLGLLVDPVNRFAPGAGYPALFMTAAGFFVLSAAAAWLTQRRPGPILLRPRTLP